MPLIFGYYDLVRVEIDDPREYEQTSTGSGRNKQENQSLWVEQLVLSNDGGHKIPIQ